jgi:hypothetical protein
MRERLAPFWRAGTRFLLPLLLAALFAEGDARAVGGCCTDAVPAPSDFPFYAPPGAGGPADVTVGKNESIQSAIERVRTGGTVRIPAGAYTGNLVIGRSMRLVAERAGTATLTATDPRKACIRINAREGTVRVFGLVVVAQPNSEAPCIDAAAQEFELSGSAVIGSPNADGVVVRSRLSFIDLNYIARAKAGVAVLSTGAGRHVVSRNDFDDNVEGLVVSGGADVLAVQNRIHRNAGRGIVNINGGGAYDQNLIDANGAGIELVYAAQGGVPWASSWQASGAGAPPAAGVLLSAPLSAGAWSEAWATSAIREAVEGPRADSTGAASTLFSGLSVEPGFSNNVIVRNGGPGVIAHGDLAAGSALASSLRASFTGNCIYDNGAAQRGRKAQIVGEDYIELVGRTNYLGGMRRGGLSRSACADREATYGDAVAFNLRGLMAWGERWRELGLRRPPVWLSAVP